MSSVPADVRRQVLAARAAIKRAGGKLPRKLRRVPAGRHPYALEAEFYRLLLAEVRALFESIQGETTIIEGLRDRVQTHRPEASRHDAMEHDLRALFEPFLRHWRARAIALRPKVVNLFTRVSEFGRNQLADQTRRVVGVDIIAAEPWLADEMSAANREAAGLITDIGEAAIARVETIVSDGVRRGTSTKSIKEAIQEAMGITERRAALIAVDQVGKLNGNLARLRQASIGVDRYTWRTCRDRRVRQAHRPREGQVFWWDDAPSDGHPGVPIRCRCIAEPCLDMFADLMADDGPVDWEAIGNPVRRR